MNGATLKNVFAYIQSAAEFRLRLIPWQQDRIFNGKKDDIFYAVDTDVVKLFSDPIGNKKYTQIFPGDHQRTSEILSWALGRFIFYGLTKDRPLLVIPPHHEEMDRVFTGITKDALKEQNNLCSVWTNITEYTHEYVNSQDADAFIASLEKEPLDLIAFVQGGEQGHTAELSRFVDMLSGERLLHIERFVDRRAGSPRTLPMLQDAVNEEDYTKLMELSRQWEDRLGETKSKRRSKTLISGDAEVLARLEWTNRALAETGERLVLISGDPALYKAADAYHDNDGASFADLYIRPPDVFMDSPNFLSTANIQENNEINAPNLVGWLDVFLARFKPGAPGYGDRLKEVINLSEKDGASLAKEFLQEFPDCITNLQRDWQAFVSLVAVQYSLSLDSEDIQKSEQLKRFVSEITEKGLQHVREKVESKLSQKWLNIWKNATLAGYWSTSIFERRITDDEDAQDPKTIPPLRGVPALRFTFEPVQSHVRNLCRSLQHENIIQPKFSFDDLTTQDPTGYAAVTLYALAFGAAGRWGVTRTMAEYALHIAEHEAKKYTLPEGHEPITGNEAAFLLAWALRQNAKSVQQLANSQKYLDNAHKLKAEATGGDGADIRYESEAIALGITYQLFRIFGKSLIPEEVPTLGQCQDKIINILERLEKGEEAEEYIVLTIKRQMFSFLFCTLLLREFKENETIDPAMKRNILKWLPKFKTFLQNNEKCLVTCFTQPVYLVVLYLYGPENEKNNVAKFLSNILSEVRASHCQVMPYDIELYNFYKFLVEHH